MDSDKTKARQIADEVFEAFTNVVKDYPWAVQKFLTAFSQRLQQTHLCESRGEDGLWLALASLLWRAPSEKYFQTTPPADVIKYALDDSLTEEFRTALNILAVEEPIVLLFMEKSHRERTCQYHDLLRAQFLFYFDSKDIDPYF